MKLTHQHEIRGHLQKIQDILDNYPEMTGLDLALGQLWDQLEILDSQPPWDDSVPFANDPSPAWGWETVEDYTERRGIWRDNLSGLGKELSAKMRSMGLEPLQVPHENWGSVNSYPTWLLDWAFARPEAS